MKEGDLKEMDEGNIRRLIKNARKRIDYKKHKQAKTNSNTVGSNLIKKRTSTEARLSDFNSLSKKR